MCLLFFQDFEGLTEVFAPRMSARNSAWTSAAYPAPKLTLWTVFLFLIILAFPIELCCPRHGLSEVPVHAEGDSQLLRAKVAEQLLNKTSLRSASRSPPSAKRHFFDTHVFKRKDMLSTIA